MEDFDKIIGENIRTARRSRKLSQEKLAELSGLSTNHISKIERGRTSVKLKTMICICETLDIPLETVIYGREEDLQYNAERKFDKLHKNMLAAHLRETLDILEDDGETGAGRLK